MLTDFFFSVPPPHYCNLFYLRFYCQITGLKPSRIKWVYSWIFFCFWYNAYHYLLSILSLPLTSFLKETFSWLVTCKSMNNSTHMTRHIEVLSRYLLHCMYSYLFVCFWMFCLYECVLQGQKRALGHLELELQIAMQVLGTKPGSSTRTASACDFWPSLQPFSLTFTSHRHFT